MARTWSAVLARLGVPTGDGRIIAPAGGSSRALPLPLLWQPTTDEGHGGAQVVGRIETLRIGDGMVTATGSILESANYALGVIEQLEAGVIGPSVDLDDIEYVMDDQERLVITQWRVAGATLVAIPAFADVSLTLDPEPVDEVVAIGRSQTDIDMDSFPHLYAAAGTPGPLPSLDDFRAPVFAELSPLVVEEPNSFGYQRVQGHIAPWGQCHIGLPGCVTAPFSASGYAYFHTGEQMTREGALLPVGTLVAGPRHADPQLAFQAATAHYDDPEAAVAKVVAGEDEFGIWVSGWLLPQAVDKAVDIFRSSPVSGDWRRIGGSLELVAVCSVNAPGFPVPRARVAFNGGAQRALIGSFGVTPVQGGPTRVRADRMAAAFQARARWAWASTTGTEN